MVTVSPRACAQGRWTGGCSRWTKTTTWNDAVEFPVLLRFAHHPGERDVSQEYRSARIEGPESMSSNSDVPSPSHQAPIVEQSANWIIRAVDSGDRLSHGQHDPSWRAWIDLPKRCEYQQIQPDSKDNERGADVSEGARETYVIIADNIQKSREKSYPSRDNNRASRNHAQDIRKAELAREERIIHSIDIHNYRAHLFLPVGLLRYLQRLVPFSTVKVQKTYLPRMLSTPATAVKTPSPTPKCFHPNRPRSYRPKAL